LRMGATAFSKHCPRSLKGLPLLEVLQSQNLTHWSVF
jgi:hypothetical protein